MSQPTTTKSRIPMAIMAGVALSIAALVMGSFRQSRSTPEPLPRTEPDLTVIREALQAEASKRLDTTLEPKTLAVTLKPATLEKAQTALREVACLPLGDSETESRWLFQGTLEEAKRLEQTLSPFGVVETAGTSAPDKVLMNITLIGGRP
jgi:hypothetical protein